MFCPCRDSNPWSFRPLCSHCTAFCCYWSSLLSCYSSSSTHCIISKPVVQMVKQSNRRNGCIEYSSDLQYHVCGFVSICCWNHINELRFASFPPLLLLLILAEWHAVQASKIAKVVIILDLSCNWILLYTLPKPSRLLSIAAECRNRTNNIFEFFFFWQGLVSFVRNTTAHFKIMEAVTSDEVCCPYPLFYLPSFLSHFSFVAAFSCLHLFFAVFIFSAL